VNTSAVGELIVRVGTGVSVAAVDWARSAARDAGGAEAAIDARLSVLADGATDGAAALAFALVISLAAGWYPAALADTSGIADPPARP
jgi:hypothetical protein